MAAEITKFTPLASVKKEAGFIAPLIGRIAQIDVAGFLGFPLIRKGEAITQEHVNRAQSMGKLFELTSSTRVSD